VTEAETALAWRLEAAFDASWPALRTAPVGDWVCKMARGLSRRSNSANALGPQARLTDAVIAACQATYAEAGQPAYVRLLSMMGPEPDDLLTAHGYGQEGLSLTLLASLSTSPTGHAEVRDALAADWLADMNAINGRTGETAQVFDAVLARLRCPAAFAAVRREGRIVSGAYATLNDGWLCMEAVATDADWRGQGLAGHVVSALMAWGATRGAGGCALQVTADNGPARALYARLGFSRELYSYHYRKAAGPSSRPGLRRYMAASASARACSAVSAALISRTPNATST
jgi:GNAT superfamily N-acetyltransferase